ncbi:hypothetical protein EVAR_46376_1 [Eumeta japonica]|uniref:Uncharacterized protein n=1 Tax=Eumeta variegata TaxID=151549 RepID=A0A4C1WY57_EUMVA|nr:hypothetical protein EVAR_46376_1 [Eumeta japonica]
MSRAVGTHTCRPAALELAVREHFEIESLGITQRERENAEVKRASCILNDTTRRIEHKWETGLLWKEDDPRFPDNYNGARKRLTNIENKMDRDPAFVAAYTTQIEKLIENGYARRFRIGSVAFTGDIRDMFLRVRVCAPDQRAQLSVARCRSRQRAPCVRNDFANFWRVVIANVCDLRTKQKCGNILSAGSRKIDKRRHRSARAGGGFDIRGWATNAPELRESLSSESSADAATVSLHKRRTERALGLIWEPECDSLGFDVTFKKLPRDIVNGKNRPTKRQFLSLIMSIFDPLGLLCPVTI